jgi:hypothetical protein
MRTVGLFLQPLPIRIPRRLHGRDQDGFKEASVANFLRAVQDSARSALGHAIEWSSLIKILSSSDDAGLRAAATTAIPNHPLFDVMVTFHELGAGAVGRPLPSSANGVIPGLQPLVSWAEGSKFGIMFEFAAVSSSSVTLRVEYDKSVFSPDEVRVFAARIDAGLGWLYENPSSVALGELERRLLDAGIGGPFGDGNITTRIEEVEFGTRLKDLS